MVDSKLPMDTAPILRIVLQAALRVLGSGAAFCLLLLIPGSALAAKHYRLNTAQPVIPGPQLKDSEFFALLDLSGPVKASIAEAVRIKDYRTARARLAAYYRRRSFERVERVMAPIIWNQQTADLALQNTVDFNGRLTFPGAFDWNYRDRRQGRELSDYLNRHHLSAVLAAAYRDSGNPVYARKCVELINDWIERCPRAGHGAGESTWLSLNTSIRLVSWVQVFCILRRSSDFQDDDQAFFLKSLAEQADYIASGAERVDGNWAFFDAAALAAVSSAFPEFKQSTEWRARALKRLERFFAEEVYPDGLTHELSPGYQAIMARHVFLIIRMLEAGGRKPPQELLDGGERLLDGIAGLIRPDGTLPRWNDTHGSNMLEELLAMADYYNRADIRYILTQGQSGRAPLGLSRRYAYGGYHVMRDGWLPGSRYLCFDAGPLGTPGHANEDKLAIDLHAFGADLLPVPGPYTYRDEPQSRYLRFESRARNTVTVDGMGQKRKGQPGTYKAYGPQDNAWFSAAGFDYASGVYDEGYGDRMKKGEITHERRIFFVRGEYWIIEDWITGSGRHGVQANFQLGPSETRLAQNGILTAETSKGNLAIVCVANVALRAVVREGSLNPVQGWTSFDYEKLLPAPHVVYEASAALPIRITTLLYPYNHGSPPRPGLQQLALDGTSPGAVTAVAVSLGTAASGRVQDLILLRHKPVEGLFRLGDRETDARFAWLRRDERGNTLRSFTFGGRIIDLKGFKNP